MRRCCSSRLSVAPLINFNESTHPQHDDVSGDVTRAASTTTTSSSSISSSTMKIDSYAVHSKNQYAAHLLTRDLLSGSMERLAKRCNLEDHGRISSGLPLRRRRMVDLGSADGSSSMETLKFAMHALNSSEFRPSGAGPISLHITFEEHPASDKLKLENGLSVYEEWFRKNDITRNVLMQSFYEPLFEPETIDFMMSYICLHWLDTTDSTNNGDISEWKTLGGHSNNKTDTSRLEWTHPNETTAPKVVCEAWRGKLAHIHLAKFLSLRSRELRPGAELVLVMVGHPHEYVTPSDGGPGPLSRAMKRCVERGELRQEVLHRIVVPYFLRTVSDVEAALKVAESLEVDDPTSKGGTVRPGALLELINCETIPAITKGDGNDPLGGAFDLFWSIHSHSIENANPTEEEMRCIKTETRRVFGEIYDADVGIPSSFVACTLRRRTRERWGSSNTTRPV